MEQISSLFKKIRDKIFLTELPKEVLKNIIKEKTGVFVENKDIDIKNKTAFIKSDPIPKSEIFVNKAEILSSFSERFGEGKITDIR